MSPTSAFNRDKLSRLRASLAQTLGLVANERFQARLIYLLRASLAQTLRLAAKERFQSRQALAFARTACADAKACRQRALAIATSFSVCAHRWRRRDCLQRKNACNRDNLECLRAPLAQMIGLVANKRCQARQASASARFAIARRSDCEACRNAALRRGDLLRNTRNGHFHDLN